MAADVGILRGASRELISALIRWTGAPELLRRTHGRRNVSILVYHDPAPAVLGRHLAYLSRRYTFATMNALVESRRSSRPMPQNALIITLDDGHQGNVDLLPVFRKYGVVPTIYLCTQVVATNRHFWWTETASADALKAVPNETRLTELAKVGFSPTKEYPEAEQQALSARDIERLEPYVDFGAHTQHHPILTQCTAAECAQEIMGSRREVEEIAQRTCMHFSYPNGDMGAREIDLVRNAGFSSARTTTPGWNDDSTSLFALRVIGAPDDASINRLAASIVVMFAKNLLRGRRGATNTGSARVDKPRGRLALQSRVHRAFVRHGLVGIARLAAHRLQQAVLLREEHVWYLLTLDSGAPEAELPGDLVLQRIDRAGVSVTEELPWGGAERVAARLGSGAEAWVARDGAATAFGCWCFKQQTPTIAMPDGWLPLAPDTACIEDVFTTPEYRGRGIASAAFRTIAAALYDEGARALIAKVEVDNVGSRRAFERAGFTPSASMSFIRVVRWKRMTLSITNDRFGLQLAPAAVEARPAARYQPTDRPARLAPQSGDVDPPRKDQLSHG